MYESVSELDTVRESDEVRDIEFVRDMESVSVIEFENVSDTESVSVTVLEGDGDPLIVSELESVCDGEDDVDDEWVLEGEPVDESDVDEVSD